MRHRVVLLTAVLPVCQLAWAADVWQADRALPAEGWTVTSSEGKGEAKMIDGDQETFWRSETHNGGEWIAVDFGRAVTVGEVRLLSGHGDGFDWGSNLNWARGLLLEVSDDGKTWRAVLAQQNTVPKPGAHLFLPLAEPVEARQLKITQTGKADDRWFFWNVHELQVFDRRVTPPDPAEDPVITIDVAKEIQPVNRKLFGVALHSVKLICTDDCRQNGQVALRRWTVDLARPLGIKATRCLLDGFNSITAFGEMDDPAAVDKKMMLSIELYALFCEQAGIPIANVSIGLESLVRDVVGDEPRGPEWHGKWLEYINCPADENWAGGVAWAAERVKMYPHRVKPYGFVHFEGANEPYARHPNIVYRKEGEGPAEAARRYSEACRAIWRTYHETDKSGQSLFGPHAIWLPRPNTEAHWGRSFVESLGGEFDFIVPHVYPQLGHFHETEGVYMELSFNPAEYIPRVLKRAADSLPATNKLGKRPFLYLNEWGVEGKRIDGKHQWDWMSTHANALMRVMTMIQFQKQQRDIRLRAATNWNLFETSGFGLMPRWDPPAFKWPTYLAYEHFNRGIGEIEVASSVSNSAVGLELPLIQVLATVSAERKKLYVVAINSYYDKDKTAHFVISGAEPDASAGAWHVLLNGEPLKRVVSMEQRKELQPTTTAIESQLPAAASFSLKLQKHSMNVLQIPLK